MIVQKRGKGIVRYQHHYRYIKRHGSGFFDFLKPVINIIKGIAAHKNTISKVFNTAKDVYKVGQNTKDIIQSIRKPKPAPNPQSYLPTASTKPIFIPDTPDLENIISRINMLRIPKSGSAIKRRKGKGFSYV